MDPDQLEKWDPDPHQNVLDPPHWYLHSYSSLEFARNRLANLLFPAVAQLNVIICCADFRAPAFAVMVSLTLRKFYSCKWYTYFIYIYTTFYAFLSIIVEIHYKYPLFWLLFTNFSDYYLTFEGIGCLFLDSENYSVFY